MATKIAKIVVDRNSCIGASTCVIIAPNAFELDDEGISVAKGSFNNHTDEELINAARSCPTQSIKLYDQDGNKIT